MSNADHFINKLDHGLDEEVRERGNNFSAGQRQLLSFARTIIHKPSVMILDEATANIDTETELLIQDSLEKMRTVGTMLIVAHRLSTIQHADNIIVLSPRQNSGAGQPPGAAGPSWAVLSAVHPAIPQRTAQFLILSSITAVPPAAMQSCRGHILFCYFILLFCPLRRLFWAVHPLPVSGLPAQKNAG